MSPQVRLAALLAACTLTAVPSPGKTRHRAPAPTVNRSSTSSRGGLVPRIAADALFGAPKGILVSKSRKTLTLLEHGQVVRTYPIAIGKAATGAKRKGGDWRTPEGLYYVAAHHPASRFTLALRVSYPNAADADRGLQAGLISAAQAEAIRRANAAGVLPPQDTALGRDIEIHGGYRPAGAGIRGYTRGCMAVTDAMIREIYAWSPDGAPILIEP